MRFPEKFEKILKEKCNIEYKSNFPNMLKNYRDHYGNVISDIELAGIGIKELLINYEAEEQSGNLTDLMYEIARGNVEYEQAIFEVINHVFGE